MTNPAPSVEQTIDLSLEAEPHEDCWIEGKEAVGYIEYTESCTCQGMPNPIPICDDHYSLVEMHMALAGPQDWTCAYCGHSSDVVAIYRRKA